MACKLYRFNPETSEWADLGKGSLRIVKSPDPAHNKQRIIIRNIMGKPLVNTYFYKNMKFDVIKNNSIKFSAYIVETDNSNNITYKGIRNFNIKVNPNNLQETVRILTAGVEACV